MIKPRKVPCSTCPYRRDVPSGIWAAAEYDLLPMFDGETGEQAMKGAFHVFRCHQRDGNLCAGWVGCHDMRHNLAIRMNPKVDHDSCLDYVCPVPLFGSGLEAAEHGKRDLLNPSPAALAKVELVLRIAGVRIEGERVQVSDRPRFTVIPGEQQTAPAPGDSIEEIMTDVLDVEDIKARLAEWLHDQWPHCFSDGFQTVVAKAFVEDFPIAPYIEGEDPDGTENTTG